MLLRNTKTIRKSSPFKIANWPLKTQKTLIFLCGPRLYISNAAARVFEIAQLGSLTYHAAACMPRPAMLAGQFLACFLSAQFPSIRAMALISHARRSSLQHFNPLSIKLSLDLLLLFFKNLDSTTLVPPFCTQFSFY